MGNCIGRNSAVACAGDEDWDESIASKKYPKRQKQRLLGESERSSSSSSSSSSSQPPSGREVKIKITKKQLDELLGKLEIHSMTLDELLSSLKDGSDQLEIKDQRTWMPTLESIPEMDQ